MMNKNSVTSVGTLAGLAIAALAAGAVNATPPNAGWVTDKPPAEAFFESIRVRGLTDGEGDDVAGDHVLGANPAVDQGVFVTSAEEMALHNVNFRRVG